MTITSNNGATTRSGGDDHLGVLRRSTTGPGPVRPRTRSWGLVALAALLVMGLGLGTAVVVSRAGEKTAALSIRTPVAKGHVIEREDLASTPVAGVEGAVPVDDIDEVVGKTSAVDLVEGQILSAAMYTADPIPANGKAVVGLALELSRAPAAGLDPGDTVDVIEIPPNENAGLSSSSSEPTYETLAAGALVYDVAQGAGGEGGQLLVTVVVDEREAPQVAAVSASNRVAVIETSAAAGGED